MKLVQDLHIRMEMNPKSIEAKSQQLEKLKRSSATLEHELLVSNNELTTLIEFQSKLYGATTEAKARVNLANPMARIVDQAFPPYRHHSPNVAKQLSYAFLAALIASSLFFTMTNRIFN